MKSVDDNHKLHYYNKKNRSELGDVLSQKISKDQKIIQGKDCILIVTIPFYMLYHTKNQLFSIMQVTLSYYAYVNNKTKCMVENFYCMDF